MQKIIKVVYLLLLVNISMVFQGQAEEELLDNKPKAILFLGIDSGAKGRVDQGRSDVIMVATFYPRNKKVSITSIPRATQAEIVVKGFFFKIKHAYAFGGVEMVMNSINQLLKIELDHSMSLKMAGLELLVDAVGGVEVTPLGFFSIDEYTFRKVELMKINGA